MRCSFTCIVSSVCLAILRLLIWVNAFIRRGPSQRGPVAERLLLTGNVHFAFTASRRKNSAAPIALTVHGSMPPRSLIAAPSESDAKSRPSPSPEISCFRF